MNLRNLFLSAAAVALVGLAASGCNENPTEPTVGTPTNLEATSLTSSSVAVRWTAVAGATSYKMAWAPTTGAGVSGDVTVTGNMANATGLTVGTRYTFTVTATTADGVSPAATIQWAGAARYNASLTNNYKMYEFESPQGSGFRLNNGGPVNVSLARGRTGIAQLAMYLKPTSSGARIDTLIVGPVLAIPEYKVSANLDLTRVDPNVYISKFSYAAVSLDSWYLDESLDTYINTVDGNVNAFVLTGAQVQNNQGMGFIVRLGAPGTGAQHNYARIVIKGGAGGIVQGTYPNRYVEMDVSYQDTPNLPFAKRAGARPNPVLYPSMILN